MKHRRIPAVFLAVSLFFLSACSLPPVSFRLGERIMISCGDRTLTEREVRLTALQYKTEYEACYREFFNEDFWTMEAAEGLTFEEYVKEYCIFDELKSVLVLNGLAGTLNVYLTDVEEEEVKEAAKAYYDRLTEDELAFTRARLSDVEKLLGRYYLADKMVQQLIRDKRIEISEEESRVADIEVIRVKTETEAKALYERLKNGENFETLARENTLDERTAFSVSKGELINVVDELVFSLSTGEVSDIIEYSGSYYLIRVADSYNTLLSLSNKRNLLAELRYENWQSAYEEYAGSEEIRRNANLWAALDLKTDGDFPDADLFEGLRSNIEH